MWNPWDLFGTRLCYQHCPAAFLLRNSALLVSFFRSFAGKLYMHPQAFCRLYVQDECSNFLNNSVQCPTSHELLWTSLSIRNMIELAESTTCCHDSWNKLGAPGPSCFYHLLSIDSWGTALPDTPGSCHSQERVGASEPDQLLALKENVNRSKSWIPTLNTLKRLTFTRKWDIWSNKQKPRHQVHSH